MIFRVEVSDRAARDLRRLFQAIDAGNSLKARSWFGSLERTISRLDQNPARGAIIRENATLRHVLHGSGRTVYRVIYNVDLAGRTVTIVHVRHGARDEFRPDEKRHEVPDAEMISGACL